MEESQPSKELTSEQTDSTIDECVKEYEGMKSYFGQLPNFEHYPRSFAHYVRLYKYHKTKEVTPEQEPENENSGSE